MYSQGEIEAAVAAGALAPEQAASFREFVAQRNNTPTPDEEYFWGVRGFNDYFVTYACVFALVSLGWLGALVPIGARGSPFIGLPNLPVLAPLLVAGGSWGLAEIFTRRRKMALPSWLLTFTFGFGVCAALMLIMAPMVGSAAGGGIAAAVAAAIAALATWGFWLRFRVPVAPAVAVGLGALAIFAVFAMMFGGSRGGGEVLSVVALAVGIGIFAYGMWWDFADPRRVTERSDIALWLHLLAAFLIVFPLASLLGFSRGIGSASAAIVMIVLYVLFALVSLVVNRKALLVAGLFPLVAAFNSFVQTGRTTGRGYGGDGAAAAFGSGSSRMLGGTVLTLVVISAILLLLAIFWSPLRRTLLGILPAALRDRLAPSETTPMEQARRFE